MLTCNSIESTFGQAAILIGSQRDSFSAVAHCLSDTSFRGATVREIKLNHGKVTLVDDEDYERVSALKWFARYWDGRWYVYRCVWRDGRSRTVHLHRFILNPPDDVEVDHRFGDGLDNRRANLRTATRSQNACNRPKHSNNTSGFKGVVRLPSGRWAAQIGVRRQHFHLGVFTSAEEAARAYDQKATELHGEFARLNFPSQPESRKS